MLSVTELSDINRSRIKAVPKRAPMTAASGVEARRAAGPVVHFPTGLPSLDAFTGGGIVFGSRWFLLGAPDAGKTALLVQLADAFLVGGHAAGLLAVDEDDVDVHMRFMQRRGVTREDNERCESTSLVRMSILAEEMCGLRIYDSTWTIEEAAADLSAYATARGLRAFFGVDSIQTARCGSEEFADSPRASVNARVQAIRDVATKYKLATVATSEMNRGAYRNPNAPEVDDLAAAKESGSIEYSGRVVLALRSVPNEPQLLELRIAKNKHGPKGERFGLRIDRPTQMLTECGLPDVEAKEAERRVETKQDEARRRNLGDAVELLRAVAEQHGQLHVRELRAALANRLGSCSAPRLDVARLLLGEALFKPDAKQAGVYVQGSKVPPDVLAALEPAERARIANLKPEADAWL